MSCAGTALSARLPNTGQARRPVRSIDSQVVSGGREFPWAVTSAPASASATAIAAPKPADAPVTSATLPFSLNESRIILSSENHDKLNEALVKWNNSLECADLSALWPVATCRDHGVVEFV